MRDLRASVDLGSIWRCPMKGRGGGPGGSSPSLVVLEEKRRLKRSFMKKHAERDARMMSQASMISKLTQAYIVWVVLMNVFASSTCSLIYSRRTQQPSPTFFNQNYDTRNQRPDISTHLALLFSSASTFSLFDHYSHVIGGSDLSLLFSRPILFKFKRNITRTFFFFLVRICVPDISFIMPRDY